MRTCAVWLLGNPSRFAPGHMQAALRINLKPRSQTLAPERYEKTESRKAPPQ